MQAFFLSSTHSALYSLLYPLTLTLPSSPSQLPVCPVACRQTWTAVPILWRCSGRPVMVTQTPTLRWPSAQTARAPAATPRPPPAPSAACTVDTPTASLSPPPLLTAESSRIRTTRSRQVWYTQLLERKVYGVLCLLHFMKKKTLFLVQVFFFKYYKTHISFTSLHLIGW